MTHEQFKLLRQQFTCIVMTFFSWMHIAVAQANFPINEPTNTSSSDSIKLVKRSLMLPTQANEAKSDWSDSVEQDFDKIRTFQSYDPSTDLWSAIENFETVEILDDTTQKREDNYIYYNFWAYNADQGHWYKVDIPDHGYKYKLRSELAKAATAAQETVQGDSAWKNLNLNLSVGAGADLYYIKPHDLQLLVRDDEYFLQSPTNKANQEAYLIKWFKGRYKKKHNVFTQHIVYHKKAQEVNPINSFVFRGLALNIPVTISLHYTFLKRLRLGIGSNFTINYLKKLYVTGKAAKVNPLLLDEPWLYDVKYFGLLGFKILQRPTSAIIIDTQLGKFYDTGSNPEIFWQDSQYLYANWYANIGLGYEKKLNNYFKLTSRLAGEYKTYDDKSYFSGTSTVDFYQTALHLDIGLSLNFAKDTDGEEQGLSQERDLMETYLPSNTNIAKPINNLRANNRKNNFRLGN